MIRPPTSRRSAVHGPHQKLTVTRHGRLSDLLALPGMQAVVVALSKDPNAKLAMLLIPPGSERPALAAKVPLTPGAAISVEREGRLLLELHELVPYPILGTIPMVIDTLEFEGRPVLVTSASAGTPMASQYHAWRHTATASRVSADFDAVETWLADFQLQTSGPPAALDMDEGTRERLRQRFAGDLLLDPVLTSLEPIYERLSQDRTQRSAVQGDLWFGNLLVADGQVCGVVDWEAGSSLGEPVRDLVQFALTYALYLDRHTGEGRSVPGHVGLRVGAWGAGIDYAINGEGWFPQLFRNFIGNGLRRLGGSPDRWRDAALAGIAQIAAMADHQDFAHDHLELLHRLTDADRWTR